MENYSWKMSYSHTHKKSKVKIVNSITFSTDSENAINGSLSRATFSRYSMLKMELPLAADIGVDSNPSFCR